MPEKNLYNPILPFHQYFRRESRALLLIALVLAIIANLVDAFTVDTIHHITYYNLPLIGMLVIVLVMAILDKIKYIIGFSLLMYSLVVNTSLLLLLIDTSPENYQLIFMRESIIFIIYYFGVALLILPYHVFIVLGVYFFLLGYTLLKQGMYFLEDNIYLVIMLHLIPAITSYLYSKRTRKGIVTMQEKNNIIEEQNEELTTQNNRLEEVNSSKDKFFSIISHDLKNPLNILLGYSEILDLKYDSMDEAKRKSILENIVYGGRQLHELLNNLLAWARTQTHGIKVNWQAIRVIELIQQETESIKTALLSKGIHLDINAQKEFTIWADKQMVSTVIRNLLSNSIKYSRINGRILIDVVDMAGTEMVSITITDNGIGMNTETVNNLFNLDRNESVKGTSGEAGTGLGLLITKEFVALNKGRITVNSKVDEGSSFCVEFMKVLNK